MNRIFTTLLFSALYIFTPSSFAECTTYWPVEVLQDYQLDVINLTDLGGNPVEKITTVRLRQLGELKRKLSAAAGVNPAFWICDGAEVNAYAQPVEGGGVIILTLGMLKALDWRSDLVAGIIGHEIAHIALDHSQAKTAQKIVATQELISLIRAENQRRADPSKGIAPIMIGAADLVILRKMIFARIDQNAEFAADERGIQLMTAAGINPLGAIQTFISMMKRGGGGQGGEFNSHPSHAERIDKLLAYMENSSKAQDLVARQRELSTVEGEFTLTAEALLGTRSTSQLKQHVAAWLKKIPDSATAWYYDGLVKVKQGAAPGLARKSFFQSVSLNPSDMKARLELCVALFSDGLKLQAVYCSRALKFEDEMDEFKERTFKNNLVAGSNVEPYSGVVVTTNKEGKKYVTNLPEQIKIQNLKMRNSYVD